MSNQTKVKVETMCWFSRGCDNKNDLIQAFQLLWVGCGWMVFTIILMSNQTKVKVEIMCWFSWGCDNKNDLTQTFQLLGFDIKVTFPCFY